MKKKFIVVAAAFVISSQLHAQNDSSAKSLEEVIVTANRLQQKQTQTGKVITVIGRDVLEKSAGRSVAQVLNTQAGITINGALNNLGTVQTTYMRGANSGRTLVLMDGIPVSDPSQINNEFDLNLLLVNDVERIEIARGAQSTLYGSDAVAGVINIITNKTNVTKPLNVKATAVAGSFNTYRGNVQVYGKANNFSYTVRSAAISSKGFSAAKDTAGNKGFDKDGFLGFTNSANVEYKASEQLQLRSFVQYNQYKTSVDEGGFRDDRDFTQRSRTFNTGVSFRFHNKAVSVAGNYMYSESYRNFLNDSTHAPGFSKYAQDDYAGKNQFVELFATIQLGKGFTLLQGADYRFNSFNSQFLSISSFGPYRSNFRDTSISQQSMYASLLYNGINEKLNIELGGRLNVHSQYGTNYTYTINPSFAITNQLRVFGSIATGFKAPSLYQLFSSAGNPELKAEKSINYETGIQYNAKNIRQRLVYFYREIETGLDFDYISFVYYNIPNQVVRGVEYEVSVTPVRNLSITGNYTYLNGNDFVQSRVTTTDTAYSYLLRRPKHHINLNIGYQFSNGVYIALQGKYLSKRFDVGGYRKADVLLKDYFIAGAYAEYKWKKHIRFFADAQNIGNSRFADLYGFNSMPFALHGGVTIDL
ncbi:vitamin B12 transporter [Lacibacter cauensis]|uniref:Vitamin B12 transporter n=1 Tax=Lacibacter cauensis TaxID=510947 RepID=A0A562SQ56_9BACT|nr:TonB-dependent receptor [Lacibacter cauensis]TWI83395.1 vitamin B12 transporter [Lacibacter cauensis]